MTNNEIIARWRGKPWRKPTHGSCCNCQTCGWWYDECQCEYDEDIYKWHGPDGLLEIIKKARLQYKFMHNINKGLPVTQRAIGEHGGMWIGLNATPAQLSDALVATIKEEK